MFGAFLIMYWGLALGVVRYRLFRLEEWWYSIWSWFLSGVAVVLLDILLIGLLDIGAGTALSLSVAVVGWLYFPLRQWLWEKLGRAPARRLQDWLPAALPLLIQAPGGDDGERRLRERWPALLATVFAPLGVEEDTAGAEAGPQILEEGLALRVPAVQAGVAPLLLRHADGGQRLFTRQDVETLAALRRLFGLALDLLRAHEAGAGAERARIARDIHDDLGAKLLSLLYRCREEDQALVRDAILCTRELVNTLSLTPISLPAAQVRLRTEVQERLAAAGVTLEWVMTGDPGAVLLSARQNANLTRILREAVTNALKHAGPRQLRLEWRLAEGVLYLSVRDDGCGMRPGEPEEGGRGMAIMRARAAELGGAVAWRASAAGEGAGCEVLVSLPLAHADGEAVA
jgi:signal transduction histidine kinase